MNKIQRVEELTKKTLDLYGFSDQVLWDECQFLFVGYHVVQIVLRDGTYTDAVRVALGQEVKQALIAEQIEVDIQVRAKWILENIGDVQPLYGGDGQLRAASVIPAFLSSGSAKTVAYVIVTWAADKAIHEIVPKANLGEAASALVRDRLLLGGESAWDPSVESTIEINAAAAPYVSRLLQRAA